MSCMMLLTDHISDFLCRSDGIRYRSLIVRSKWRDSIPFAQWSLGVLGADSVLPFALTNSGHFRLCRTAHRADASLVCRGLLVPNQRFGRFFRLFPLPSGICRQRPFLPVFSACLPVFPRISKRFLSGHLAFRRFNRPLQPLGLQHSFSH